MSDVNKEISVKDLQSQIADLQAQLLSEKEARSAAEDNAKATADAGIFVNRSDEQPTGKTIKIQKCSNPWETDERKQKLISVDVPTYYYQIQLPTGSGISLTTNGQDFRHGDTYTVDLYTLIDLKSRVARCWDHEKSIHGDNENAYRRPTNRHFMGK
jgi:hypothetical protein